jgi:CRISPR-associated endonuclease Csn1
MLIFGLDIGTTSIGFAVIEHDDTRGSGHILRLGARIFPEARDPDGTPLNQQRRAKRMMRRQLRRRRARRRSLNELLAANGLLPPFGGDEWIAAMGIEPYALRARGLAEALTPYELGRALYHLSKRRHFRERDLAESDDPREEAKKADEEAAAKTRQGFVAQLKASGETLGEALSRRGAGERRRGEHATRAVVEEEFARLRTAQALHHPILRDHAFAGALQEAIFAQRPVFWRKSTLGACRFFPDAPLCPKGSWLSQQRVMLEKVNNLAIAGGNARPLDAEERRAILAALATQKKMGWNGVRAVLEPIFKARGESAKYARFNLEYGDEKGGLRGNLIEADLAKIFGARWANHPQKTALREFAPRALWEADYGEVGAQRVVIRRESERAHRRAVLADRLIADFAVSREEAAALTKLHFPQGWEPFSTKALEIFLPELEKGVRFGTLLARAGMGGLARQAFPGSRTADGRSSRPSADAQGSRRSAPAIRGAQPDRRARAERNAESRQ